MEMGFQSESTLCVLEYQIVIDKPAAGCTLSLEVDVTLHISNPTHTAPKPAMHWSGARQVSIRLFSLAERPCLTRAAYRGGNPP
jgi:hypothetical protein